MAGIPSLVETAFGVLSISGEAGTVGTAVELGVAGAGTVATVMELGMAETVFGVLSVSGGAGTVGTVLELGMTETAF